VTAHSSRRWHKRHKQNGICTECCRPAIHGQTMCEDHRDRFSRRHRERYEWLKSMGFCVKCGSKETRGVGHIMCEECNTKKNMVQRKLAAQRRAKLKALGMCIRCSKQPSRIGAHSFCVDCNEIHNRYNRLEWKRRKQYVVPMGNMVTNSGTSTSDGH